MKCTRQASQSRYRNFGLCNSIMHYLQIECNLNMSTVTTFSFPPLDNRKQEWLSSSGITTSGI